MGVAERASFVLHSFEVFVDGHMWAAIKFADENYLAHSVRETAKGHEMFGRSGPGCRRESYNVFKSRS